LKPVLARTAAALIILGAAVAVFAALSLPPARLHLAAPPETGAPLSIPGTIHVHSNRSDGRGTPDAIAAAAARAGLKFLVLTDHGDGTRMPDPPAYRNGVLVIDGVEISTTGGHYIAIDMPAAPYPLSGEARDVVEDVRRLGGFGIVAHPDSPKRELQWREWDAPFDAIEIVNPDTSWRVQASRTWRARGALLRALFTYALRPEETVAGFLSPSRAIVEQWMRISRQRPVVAIAGVDAHARLALLDVDPGDNRFSLPFPGYEPLFRTLSVRVEMDRPLTGDPAADANAIVRGIRAGRLFVAADGIAGPPAAHLSGRSGEQVVGMGEHISAGPLSVDARSNAPASFSTIVWQGTDRLSEGTGSPAAVQTRNAGPVWMEVRASSRSNAPLWLLTNPIFAGFPDPQQGPPSVIALPAEAERWLVDDASIGTWTTERDPASTASLTITARGGGPELAFDYALAAPGAAMPYAALAVFTRGGMLAGLTAVQFEARADRPMRLSVQLRAEDVAPVDHRWARSVYLDGAQRSYRIPFDEFRPVGGTRVDAPLVSEVHSIVFVVDTINTRPGTSGQVILERVGVD
jgi:hypothetical protein